MAAEAVIFFDNARASGMDRAPQARRATRLEAPLCLGAVRSIPCGWPVAQAGTARPARWRNGSATVLPQPQSRQCGPSMLISCLRSCRKQSTPV